MCGINGVISNQKISNLADIISAMNEKLIHRGPDGKGVWINEEQNIGLGHTRLSILDLSSLGSQPMRSSSFRYVILVLSNDSRSFSKCSFDSLDK